MKKLLILSIALGAVYYLFFNISATSFDDAGNPTAIVFTQNNCGSWCDDGIKDLKRRKIKFTEFPIDNNKENKDRYESISGKGLPFFVMGDQTLAGYGKYQFMNMVAQAFGDVHLTRREKSYFRNHFYNDGKPRIYVYGASWCPYCKKLRQQFAEKGVDYVELDVEKANEPQLIANTMGINGYPVVYVGYVRVKYDADLYGNVMDVKNIAGDRIL